MTTMPSASHVSDELDVVDVLRRGRVDADLTGDAGVVEEVEIRVVGLLAVGGAGPHAAHETRHHIRLAAHGKGRVVDRVLDGDGEEVVARLEPLVQLHLERQEAANVAADLVPVEEHLGMVRDSGEAQHDALAEREGRDSNRALVEGPATEFAEVDPLFEVVVGRRDGHGQGIVERPGRPAVVERVPVVELEVPDTVEALDESRGSLLGI